MIAMLASLGNRPAELAFCFGTGHTTRQRNLDTGMIEKGFCADFVLMDQAQHTPGKTILESIQFGNLPGIGMTIIDGAISSHRSPTPPRLARHHGRASTRAQRWFWPLKPGEFDLAHDESRLNAAPTTRYCVTSIN